MFYCAKYGSKMIDALSSYLTKEYGIGFSRSNVAGMRQFYMTYKDMENEIIQSQIGQLDITYSKLPFKLSWTHYQVLMRIEDKDERFFYLNNVRSVLHSMTKIFTLI